MGLMILERCFIFYVLLTLPTEIIHVDIFIECFDVCHALKSLINFSISISISIPWLKKLRDLNKPKRQKFINGFISNIYGLFLLSEKLSSEYGISEIRTRNLASDGIENTFGKVRKIFEYPCPYEFAQAIKKISCDILTFNDSGSNTNCEFDAIPDFVNINEWLEQVSFCSFYALDICIYSFNSFR